MLDVHGSLKLYETCTSCTFPIARLKPPESSKDPHICMYSLLHPKPTLRIAQEPQALLGSFAVSRLGNFFFAVRIFWQARSY